jgi:hypothetical protein
VAPALLQLHYVCLSTVLLLLLLLLLLLPLSGTLIPTASTNPNFTAVCADKWQSGPAGACCE